MMGHMKDVYLDFVLGGTRLHAHYLVESASIPAIPRDTRPPLLLTLLLLLLLLLVLLPLLLLLLLLLLSPSAHAKYLSEQVLCHP